MLYYHRGSPRESLSSTDLREGIIAGLAKIGNVRNMLLVPPDITRVHSRAGELAQYAYECRPDAVTAIIPALGTHAVMNDKELSLMFGGIPRRLFRWHNWRADCVPLGTVPADFVASVSGGAVDYPISLQINKALVREKFDCIFSFSQVVPHEVAGMAGYSKNIVVGLGGPENIHKSHFLGAAYGMEKIMGRPDSPVRKVLDYATEHFLSGLPIVHAVTVLSADPDGSLGIRGLFIGDDRECYQRAAALSQQVNIHLLDKRIKKIVAFLDPLEYKSTWLGNKSIYRTRMAIDDGGELVVLAPGVAQFGEDPQIDRLIRKFGYTGTPAVMQHAAEDAELKQNLSAAAHLIHGSSEGRFSITYCTGGLTAGEIEKAGFRHAPVNDMMKRYNPGELAEGFHRLPDGEEIFFIANPATGLWAWKETFR